MYSTVHYSAVETFFIWESYLQTENFLTEKNRTEPCEQTKERQIYIYNMHSTLQRHNTENSKKYSQKRNFAATVLILKFMLLWAIYIFPWSVCLFCWRKIDGPNVGIYRPFTDTWMWKLELRPHNSFSGNT
jgi:hypothetical protein